MVLTKAQWLEKLKANVPGWFFEETDVNEAVFSGIAAVLAAVDEDAQALFLETFILTASSDTLEEYGRERSIPRLLNELDPSYKNRLRNISNQSNCPAIKASVDAILIAGESIIIEDFDSARFMNREVFLNRNEVLIQAIENTFSILVDKQIHTPYSFNNREYFNNREDFMGMAESDQTVFDTIVQEVNRIRMCGTFFRVIEFKGE